MALAFRGGVSDPYAGKDDEPFGQGFEQAIIELEGAALFSRQSDSLELRAMPRVILYSVQTAAAE